MSFYSKVPESFPKEIQDISFPEYIEKYKTWLLFDTKQETIIIVDSDMNIYKSEMKTMKEEYDDYWFRHHFYENNTIIITDYLGIRVYDMKLNLKKEIKLTEVMKTEGSVYGFEYNEIEKELRIWIVDDKRLAKDRRLKMTFDRYTEFYFDMPSETFNI